MTLISLAEIPRVQDVQLSPDGRTVSYMLARADWKAGVLLAHIWLQPVAGGKPTQLTSGESGELLARWSPDSRTLLYVSRGQIWLIAADGGAPRQLTRHSTGVYGGAPPAWSPDGSAIYFLANDPATDAERERERLRDDVYAFEQEFQAPPSLEDQCRHRRRAKADRRTVLDPLVPRLVRRHANRSSNAHPRRSSSDLGRGEIWITDADGQKRTPGDEERHRRSRRRAVARQLARAVHRLKRARGSSRITASDALHRFPRRVARRR